VARELPLYGFGNSADKMTTHSTVRGSAPPEIRATCRYCGSTAIRTVVVPWFTELEYLTCERCGYTWTVQRKERDR
jgi:formate dehydrogenase maturation protein FdhE